jgi:hypothetical protein
VLAVDPNNVLQGWGDSPKEAIEDFNRAFEEFDGIGDTPQPTKAEPEPTASEPADPKPAAPKKRSRRVRKPKG